MQGWLRKFRTFLPQEIAGIMADIYDKVATTALADFHQQLASEITSSLTTGRVLDVGTGPGHLLVDIAAANPNLKLTGIDLSKKMLQIAKELMRNQGLPCSELVFNSNPDTSDVQLIHGEISVYGTAAGSKELTIGREGRIGTANFAD